MAQPGVDGIRSLRAFLKVALRRFGLRAVDVRELKPDETQTRENSMSCNPCLEAAVAELEAVGIRSYQLARGGKHLQLRWSVNGHPLRILALPCTPSDWRSPRNTRRDIRRLLRLDGLLEMPRSNGHAQTNARACSTESWRQQIEALARQLNQVNIPHELAAKRDEIVAALHGFTRENEP